MKIKGYKQSKQSQIKSGPPHNSDHISDATLGTLSNSIQFVNPVRAAVQEAAQASAENNETKTAPIVSHQTVNQRPKTEKDTILNEQSQALALRKAAASGTPFCEICN